MALVYMTVHGDPTARVFAFTPYQINSARVLADTVADLGVATDTHVIIPCGDHTVDAIHIVLDYIAQLSPLAPFVENDPRIVADPRLHGNTPLFARAAYYAHAIDAVHCSAIGHAFLDAVFLNKKESHILAAFGLPADTKFAQTEIDELIAVAPYLAHTDMRGYTELPKSTPLL